MRSKSEVISIVGFRVSQDTALRTQELICRIKIFANDILSKVGGTKNQQSQNSYVYFSLVSGY